MGQPRGKVYFRALRQSLELMRDGRLDAVSVTVQFPQTLINQASLKQDLQLLPLSGQAIEFVNRRLGTYPSRIPAGAYSFVGEDIPTLSDVVLLIANARLSDDHAYEVAKAIFKNLSYLHKVHKALARLSPDQMPQVNQVPLHPGALRLYTEAGLR
ncbi:MAG: TAXI family TRAP transporter solute-binding subunit [Acidobacteriota bacterium]